VVWTPKYRGKVLADQYIKQELKRILKIIAKWKGVGIRSWHVGDEHIHLHITIPPKFSVAYVIQILKGKSSAWLRKKTKRFPDGALWARGYFVSTLGLDEYAVKRYIENQQHHQIELIQQKLKFFSAGD
jgi:putative transposase